MVVKELFGLGTAIVSDTLVEILGGFLPIFGDFLDGIQLVAHLSCFGIHLPFVVGAGEFIPFVGDVLPLHTGSAVWAILRGRRKKV